MSTELSKRPELTQQIARLRAAALLHPREEGVRRGDSRGLGRKLVSVVFWLLLLPVLPSLYPVSSSPLLSGLEVPSFSDASVVGVRGRSSCLGQWFSTGRPQECLKHEISDSLVRGTDPFPLTLSDKK